MSGPQIFMQLALCVATIAALATQAPAADSKKRPPAELQKLLEERLDTAQKLFEAYSAAY